MAVQISGNDITVPRDTTVTRNLTVGGVLTYEDVTNVDSIGIVTARAGVLVGSGITLSKDGDIFATGVTTTGSLVSSGDVTANGGDMTISGANAILHLIDANDSPNYRVQNIGGTFQIYDATTDTARLSIASGGAATFSGDVNIADKIIHTGDTDTLIRFPSADTIRFDTGGTEAARINSSQKLIIGDTNSDAQLGVYRSSYNIAEFCNTNADATGAEVALRKDSSSPADGDTLGMLKFIGDNDAGEKVNYAYIQSKSTDVSDGTEDGRLEFYTRGAGTLSERARIESNGNVVLNHTASITYNGHDPKLSIQGTTYSESTLAIISNTNENNGAYIFLGKQRSGSAGGSTLVQDGDLIGQFRYLAGDGTDLQSEVANITVSIDGTPGGNDVPGRITFATTNDGGNTSTERMRIDSEGVVRIGENGTFTPDTGADELVIGNANSGVNRGMSIYNHTGSDGRICFAQPGDPDAGMIKYSHGSDVLQFFSEGDELGRYKNQTSQTEPTLELRKPNGASNVQSHMIHLVVGGHDRGALIAGSSFGASAIVGAISDYRVKTNIRDYTGGWDNIKALPVKIFDISKEGEEATDIKGWIAHEVQSVIPEAVCGNKDAKKEDGSDDLQSLGYNVFMPDVVGALQTAMAKIETLEAEVAALKSS